MTFGNMPFSDAAFAAEVLCQRLLLPRSYTTAAISANATAAVAAARGPPAAARWVATRVPFS